MALGRLEMQLALLGWDETFSAAFGPDSCSGLTEGRVILQHNHIYTVATETGEIHTQVSGHLRHKAASADELPAVGDWVALRLSSGEGTALIQTVLPRRSKFTRKAAGRALREQVVAANIDSVFLLVGMDNDFSPRRVERYLAAAWESGAAPVVVLNKLDLCADPAARVAHRRCCNWSAGSRHQRVARRRPRSGCRLLCPVPHSGSARIFRS